MHSLFEIQHLSYAYHTMQGETAALSDITFTVNTGDFVAIVGPSGCGKSTLLNLLAGMLTPESGTLLLNGTPLTADSRCHIGYMLQQDYLLEWRSIWKNVLLGLEIRHEVTEESCSYAKQLLKQYGLEKFSHSKPSQLSGGMRQRAALVRTLVLKPDLLLRFPHWIIRHACRSATTSVPLSKKKRKQRSLSHMIWRKPSVWQTASSYSRNVPDVFIALYLWHFRNS